MNKTRKQTYMKKWIVFFLFVAAVAICPAAINWFINNQKDFAVATLVKAAEYEDGEYTMEVSMEGGSGRATIESPVTIVVENGKCFAYITWSSSNYDYMIVENEKLFPVNDGGNSVFYIPVTALDAPMTVIADTTAMSTPHEITYNFTFDSSTMKSKAQFENEKTNKVITRNITIVICVLLVVIVFVCVIIFFKKTNQETNKESNESDNENAEK